MAHASVMSEAELINLPWRQSSSWGGLPSVPLAEVLKGRGLFPEARSLLIVGRGAEHSLSLPLSRGLESGLLLDGGAGGLLFAAKGAEPLAELERIEIGRFLWSAPGPSPIVST